jgi:hypothetical protein
VRARGSRALALAMKTRSALAGCVAIGSNAPIARRH